MSREQSHNTRRRPQPRDTAHDDRDRDQKATDRAPAPYGGYGPDFGAGTYVNQPPWRTHEGFGLTNPGFGPGPVPRDVEAHAHRTYRNRKHNRGPKNYTRSDERIREDVCDRIIDSGIDASDVEIDVKDGDVSMKGTVQERWMKHEIEDIADCCSGVTDVDNRIRVSRRSGSEG